MIHCKDCVWFASIHSIPEAEALHNHLVATLGDILPRREGEVGVCRKTPGSSRVPLLTNENGFCHRAERREPDDH